MRLNNKKAIITGAASGVGKASALLFAREGAKVVVVDIDEQGGGATLDAVRGMRGEGCFVQADVSKERDAERIVEGALNAFGGIDILFNNAAVSSFKSVMEVDEAEIDRVMNVNVKGAFFCSKAVIPHLRRAGGGSIINTSSITGIVGAPGMAVYTASKGAVITLTRTLALEQAEGGIRVNCICPASIDTPMLNDAFERTADAARARQQNIKRHPLGRLGTAEDVAYLALFLASDEAGFITGGTFVIDGGASLARRWKD
jgi:3-oxoacyl-[acyl-carrier protein] reductase